MFTTDSVFTLPLINNMNFHMLVCKLTNVVLSTNNIFNFCKKAHQFSVMTVMIAE